MIDKIREQTNIRLEFMLEGFSDHSVGLYAGSNQFSIEVPAWFMKEYNENFEEEDKRNFWEAIKTIGLFIDPEAKLWPMIDWTSREY